MPVTDTNTRIHHQPHSPYCNIALKFRGETARFRIQVYAPRPCTPKGHASTLVVLVSPSIAAIIAGALGFGYGWRHRATDYGRTRDRVEVGLRTGRLGPVRAAVAVVGMLAEEGADAIRAEVGHAVLAGLGEDDGVGQDELVLVDAALQVTENVVAAGDVVAEV